MRRGSAVWVVCLLILGIASGSVSAQDKRATREREAIRRLQQQAQQMRQENDALGARLTASEQEKQELSRQRDSLAGAVGGARGIAREQQDQRAQLQAQYDALVQQLQAVTLDRQNLQTDKLALEKRFSETQARLVVTTDALAREASDRQQADATVTARDRQVSTCEDKNTQLYQHGRDLIAQCRDRSATDTVLRLEPFTGIGQVAIENRLEEYRDKLDAHRLWPSRH